MPVCEVQAKEWASEAVSALPSAFWDCPQPQIEGVQIDYGFLSTVTTKTIKYQVMGPIIGI